MKKRISSALIVVLLTGLLLSLSACGADSPSGESLSLLVGKAILADNTSVYLDGECSGEGHKILDFRESDYSLKVYALTMFGNYGFRNDMFIKASGSGVIPAVLTFEKDGTEYRLLGIEYPRDGAEYTKSIKQMFPLKYRAAALNSDSAYDELLSQEKKYAEEYLQSIGRDAEIGEYKDLNIVLLTDLGVSVEVSNQLTCDKDLGDYPYWIGSSEYLENGIRYVRSLSYDENAGLIIYSICEKDTGEITECFVFDASTGEPRSTGSVVSQVEPAGLPADIDNNETENPSTAVLPEEQDPESSVPQALTLDEVSSIFASAYFSHDADIIRSFLSSDFTGDQKDVSPWSRVDIFKVNGAEDETTDRPDGTKTVSVEFRNPDYPDSFVYLTIGLVKEDNAWRVQWYGLEEQNVPANEPVGELIE